LKDCCGVRLITIIALQASCRCSEVGVARVAS
jgi:hypothetical protein